MRVILFLIALFMLVGTLDSHAGEPETVTTCYVLVELHEMGGLRTIHHCVERPLIRVRT